MRGKVALFVVAVTVGAVACGDAQPRPQAPATGAAPSASAATAGAGDAGPTTTTTQSVGGGSGGARLTPSASDAGTDGPHKHPYEPGRSVADIAAIIAAHRDEARACYDNALVTHPGIQGNLDVKWTIDPAGVVTVAEIDTSRSDILEPAVGNCVIAIIKKIHFNASAMRFESQMHYPFNFRPRPKKRGVDGGT